MLHTSTAFLLIFCVVLNKIYVNLLNRFLLSHYPGDECNICYRLWREASLKEAIIKRFSISRHFYTCSAENMNIDELIEFLKRKGKFMPLNDGFTVDLNKVCSDY
ncbi:hypothetical protein IX307_000808 [Bacteroides pyogenes]|uniref:Uncharacterized protein n=2 Tax=Bacteroides pyogenes TaxID=310300 RepID=W4PCP9_9BACE|nr:hypothetical protein [Bacteroides pyogenes]GAE14516.1 hypothetical protein JCM6292_659 [Bacteroides pyogenes JCM 6292]GAE17576.1 hypothetical protein JCM6294_344 [Bacteroides pyogenes DSM 20611 = JCM 6294]MBR8708247.1 hypothetical protein [Bacteroides pyogenes]MBR8718337.1 hypothetical protein [Bacteroides pyogenes]